MHNLVTFPASHILCQLSTLVVTPLFQDDGHSCTTLTCGFARVASISSASARRSVVAMVTDIQYRMYVTT